MPRKPKPQPDDPAESKRFIDMARQLGADETETGRERFERVFRKVAEKPKPATPKGGSRDEP
jgi:hypothetical protein